MNPQPCLVMKLMHSMDLAPTRMPQPGHVFHAIVAARLRTPPLPSGTSVLAHRRGTSPDSISTGSAFAPPTLLVLGLTAREQQQPSERILTTSFSDATAQDLEAGLEGRVGQEDDGQPLGARPCAAAAHPRPLWRPGQRPRARRRRCAAGEGGTLHPEL